MPKRRNVPAEIAQARGHLGGLVRSGADPEAIQLAELRLAALVARSDVRKWRPLTDADRMEIAGLVLTGRGDVAP